MRLAGLLPAFADPERAAQAAPDEVYRSLACLASVLVLDADAVREAADRRVERRAQVNYDNTEGVARVLQSLLRTDRELAR
jgi:hypothetical protein